ncbi:protein-tyrosine phosphatase family protein [Pseudonocardia sp. KRD291]|uniref:phosphatase domain-containing protein n=1 Tax=Pseudonocardia sp. KRD291 TaxID=2792007 RepID=UPI001C49F859|nr:protein-tyrosine phosphatase family protein [Pseudonocardia sp. KRD291]MBW0102190.1 phosphatase [Pseudonocardia sp. KRD291]
MSELPLAGAIRLPDGTLVRGRGRRDPLPEGPAPQFGLYPGRPPDRGRRTLLRRTTPWLPDWPAEWVDWPDFRTPRDPRRAAAAIVRAHDLARAGHRVEVACGGGVGRTGTVIACMAVIAGHPPDDAVAWTRRNYRSRAVETRGQRRWVAWFAEHRRRVDDLA